MGSSIPLEEYEEMKHPAEITPNVIIMLILDTRLRYWVEIVYSYIVKSLEAVPLGT